MTEALIFACLVLTYLALTIHLVIKTNDLEDRLAQLEWAEKQKVQKLITKTITGLEP